MDTPERQSLKLPVKSDTRPKDLGWAIYRFYEEGKLPHLVAIGVAAIAQGVKAVVAANTHMAAKGKTFDISPHFTDVQGSDSDGNDGIIRAFVMNLRIRDL